MLPLNVDLVEKTWLEDPRDGERVRRVFERGLSKPVGMVLPLERARGKSGPEWQTGLWMLRGQRLMLIPGDSPLGLRLPLPSLPWVAPGEGSQIIDVDPMVNRGPLPRPKHVPIAEPPVLQSREPSKAERTERDRKPKVGESAPWVVRTALCVEPRHGRLHIFMPPLARAEDYIDLLTAIEDTAAYLKTPVVIEGYPPPHDPRIKNIKVTPDPGVIEVNIQPASNWLRNWWTPSPRFMKTRGNRDWGPRNSCWTAGTPAPAAAIISCSAVPRRRTVRSCGGRT